MRDENTVPAYSVFLQVEVEDDGLRLWFSTSREASLAARAAVLGAMRWAKLAIIYKGSEEIARLPGEEGVL